MSLVPGKWSLNPWNFLRNRSIFSIHGGPLEPHLSLCQWDNSGLRLVTLERSTMWWEVWGFESQDISWTSGERDWAGVWLQSYGQWFKQSCLYNKTPIKTLAAQSSCELSGWWYTLPTMVTCPEDMETPCLGPSWSLPMCLFIWLFLICILYNRTVIVSVVLSWVQCVYYSSKLSNPREPWECLNL